MIKIVEGVLELALDTAILSKELNRFLYIHVPVFRCLAAMGKGCALCRKKMKVAIDYCVLNRKTSTYRMQTMLNSHQLGLHPAQDGMKRRILRDEIIEQFALYICSPDQICIYMIASI